MRFRFNRILVASITLISLTGCSSFAKGVTEAILRTVASDTDD